MKYKTIYSLQLPGAMTAIILSFLFVFANSLQAVSMPAYKRLEPLTLNLSAPTAVALDINQNLYVVESTKNRLLVFSQSGEFLGSMGGLKRPISVAVDSNRRIFIGNSDSGTVEVYNTDFTLLFTLGSGDGEFIKPGSIAIDSTDTVYVADSGANNIKVYYPDGSYNFSFGTSGSGNGQFTFPTSIAIDSLPQEIIVSDLQMIQSSGGSYEGARIQIFDMNGGFKRSFGVFGQGDGKLTKPMGVAVDGEGRIYVTDAYQNVVQVFDAYGAFLGTIYELNHPMRTPLGIAIGRNNRLFIASLNTGSIESYGIGLYTHMVVMPRTLLFEGQQFGTNPAAQNMEIRNNGSVVLNWTALSSDGWITLSQQSGITAPSMVDSITIGVSLTGLSPGTYTGTVEIIAESGAAEIVTINLTVIPAPVLSVTPSSLEFASEQGAIPISQNLSINNTGGGRLDWSASTDRTWVLLDKNSGLAPDAIAVSVDISSLSEGTHSGNITVTAEGAVGSPVTVPVMLNIVVLKGTVEVSTNLEAATFTISGPASYSGSGTDWAVTDAPIGMYAIIFGDIDGYITPPSEIRTLHANGSISFTGQYEKDTPARMKDRNIIVGAGPGKSNAAFVKVLHYDGTPTGVEFLANEFKYGVNVASGDLDGDGYDEIITAPGPGSRNPGAVKIFDRNGNHISGMNITAYGYRYGANVASGDFDGDGRYEVVTGTGEGAGNSASVKVFVYEPVQQKMADSGINLIAYGTKYGVRVAAGDIDGDGIPEIITAPGHGGKNKGIVRIWKIDTSSGIGQWGVSFMKEFTVTSAYPHSISIASGDVNGDGYNEIITGAIPYKKAVDEIKVFDQEGIIISEFRAHVDGGYGANVAAGDLDGDGVADIITGAGSYAGNGAYVKIYNAFGIEKEYFKAMNSLFGANVAVGYFGFEILE